MRKIILLVFLVLVTVGIADGKDYKYEEKCAEPYHEYVYYNNKSNEASSNDEKSRWIEIAEEFKKSYDKCVKGVNSNTINKHKSYKTFKE